MADVQKATQPISEGAGKATSKTPAKTPTKTPTTPSKAKKTQAGTQTTKTDKPKIEQPKFEKPKQVEETQQKAEQTKDDVQDTAEETTEGAEVPEEAEDAEAPESEVPEAPSEVPDVPESEIEDQAEDAGYGTSETAHENLEGQVHDAEGNVEDAAEGAEDEVDGAQDEAEDQKEDVEGEVEDQQEGTEGEVEGQKEELEGQVEGAEGELEDKKEGVDGEVEGAEGQVEGQEEGLEGQVDETKEGAEEGAEELGEEATKPLPDISILKGLKVNKAGNIVDESGKPLGRLIEGDPKKLAGKTVDEEGKIWNDSGKVLGQAETLPQEDEEEDEGPPFEDFPDAIVDKSGKVLFEDRQVGVVSEGEISKLVGKKIDEDGDILDKNGNVIGKAVRQDEEEPQEEVEEPEQPRDLSLLKGLKVNKAGNIVDDNGNPIGRLVEGDAKKLAGKTVDEEGKIWNDSGKVIGQAELLPEPEENESAPFEDFPDSVVDKSGKILFEGKQVGVVTEGEVSKLVGKKVDADGDIVDKNGNVVGKAERQDEEEPEPEPEAVVDYSAVAGAKINKAGNAVNDKGIAVGRILEGQLKLLIGRQVDDKGQVWNDNGKVIGKVEPIPEEERIAPSEGPFEDFPDAIVERNGDVIHEGEKIGIVVEGEPKKLAGKKVDSDGDIVDKAGNVVGKAERWEEEEAAPEPEVDYSSLAGKRVNKAGNLVDSHGDIFGRVKEGVLKNLVGKMADKTGAIRNEGGDIVGRAELVPESEREGLKEGPFADIGDCTVTKEGKVVDSKDVVVGRLIQGDGKQLYGKKVDDDGDVLDKNGNSIGKAERWEEEEVEKEVHPLAGHKVNKKGEVVDENGDLAGKLTSGDLQQCVGKKIDNDGDVVDGKGTTIGHISLLDEIPDEEPEVEEPQESEEDKKAREQKEKDNELAGKMAVLIDNSLEKLNPILKQITGAIETAERKPKEELDEEALVKKVKPLIEQGSSILQETNGAIRGLDPDGRIAANAKHKTAGRDATPEEHRLAEKLKELASGVKDTIDRAKAMIADMPHAKKELNPLWGLLAEPLGQIIAAVGLLLSGVLGLVGKLLGGLGLGGLLDGLLGGLGLKNILNGLGLGNLTGALTGKK